MFFVFSLDVHHCVWTHRQQCLHVSIFPVCLFRKMTFGKVNELGQFIRESEPEPDAKKSKGAVVLSLSHPDKLLSLRCVWPLFPVKNIHEYKLHLLTANIPRMA